MMISIDASSGSDGGLILRAALALSALTGKAVRLTRIRARRTTPGLKLQHLRLIDALARLSCAFVDGAALGSQSLSFEPRQKLRAESVIDIDTPGSLTLLLQTLLLPLSFSGQVLRLRLVGVTHGLRCHTYENLSWHWLPLLERAGYRAELKLQVAGFSPKGGGVVHATIHPVLGRIEPLCLVERGALLSITGQSVVACLDQSVAERQRTHVLSRLGHLDVPIRIVSGTIPAVVPGAFIILLAEFEHSQQCFFALGELGKSPEVVASEVSEALTSCLASGGALDSHLASQLLLPMSFADGDSELSVSEVSEHMLATAELIDLFMPGTVSISGQPGEPGQLIVCGRGVPEQAWQNRAVVETVDTAARAQRAEHPARSVYSNTQLGRYSRFAIGGRSAQMPSHVSVSR